MNPSFEDTIQCVINHSQFQGYVQNWRGGDGEYFNSICQGWQCEVPSSIFGYQQPRTGIAFAGIYCTIVDTYLVHENARDMIEAKLIEPMLNGSKYCVSFYVSLADSVKYACPIGYHISQDSAISFNSINWSGPSPSFMDTSLTRLKDTMNWTLISSIYTANGGERFVTIGNFWNDTLTPLMIVKPNASIQYSSCYYNIDDVSVVRYVEASLGDDSIICNGDSVMLQLPSAPGIVYSWSPGSSLSDSTTVNPVAFPAVSTTYTLTISDPSGLYCLGNVTDSIRISVNDCAEPQLFFIPTLLKGNDQFTIVGLPPESKLEVFDLHGRLIYRSDNYLNNLEGSLLAAGIYIYRLTLLSGEVQSGKFEVIP